jgi:hypothetical protein
VHLTHQKGEIAQLKVMLRAAEKGVVLSRPVVESRYDFILDDGKKLERVQVKYADGRWANSQGSVRLCLKSWQGRKLRRTYGAHEVDALLVYVAQTDEVLRFETDTFCGRSGLTLRLKPARNGQVKGTLDAKDFVW